MQGTIITLPSRGPPVGKTINESPTLERLKAAVGGGDIELVPGFDTIEYGGEIVPCIAFCDKESKLKSRPTNHDAVPATPGCWSRVDGWRTSCLGKSPWCAAMQTSWRRRRRTNK